jgi:3-oxoacyl-[acyl-carrier protein] reductase
MLSESWSVNKQAAEERFNATIPLGRIGSPEDTAAAAVFFASLAAEWTTGQCISVAGGP